MPILALGVSYRRTPVELLERLAFSAEDFSKAYHHLTRTDSVRGAVLLSTCNRVEVFAEVDAYHSGFQALKQFLCESREVAAEEIGDLLYSHYDEHAAEHLFSVAAGMDSMVLGEPQILSQVRQAYKAAEAEEATGPLLQGLFRRAIRAGRRVRAETAIGASPAAFVEAGTRVAEGWLGALAGRRALVVGAGKMGELSARHLRGLGVGELRVLSRRPERAERLARSSDASWGGVEDLPAALAGADLVVSATGATGAVIGAEAVAGALEGRSGRPLFIVDLAVPRDVEPSVRELPGVGVVDIDGLRDFVARTDWSEVDRARAIVAEEVARFTAWRRAARLAPVIQGLYDRGERIRRAELERVRARLAALSEDERAAVEAATRAIVAKLLHRPVVKAKELHDSGDPAERVLAELFDLDVPREP